MGYKACNYPYDMQVKSPLLVKVGESWPHLLTKVQYFLVNDVFRTSLDQSEKGNSDAFEELLNLVAQC